MDTYKSHGAERVSVPSTCCCLSGGICSDNSTYRHIEIEVADQTHFLAQSRYTDRGLTSPSADPITPSPWQQGSHYSPKFEGELICPDQEEAPERKRDSNPSLPLSRLTPCHKATEVVKSNRKRSNRERNNRERNHRERNNRERNHREEINRGNNRKEIIEREITEKK